jgi:hypothetical protein
VSLYSYWCYAKAGAVFLASAIAAQWKSVYSLYQIHWQKEIINAQKEEFSTKWFIAVCMRLGEGSFRTCCEYNQFICIMLCACHFICIICISTEQMQTKILEWHQNEINDFFVCLKWINSLGPNIFCRWIIDALLDALHSFRNLSLDLLQGCVSFSIFLRRYRFTVWIKLLLA